jgi:hypothetical protein
VELELRALGFSSEYTGAAGPQDEGVILYEIVALVR